MSGKVGAKRATLFRLSQLCDLAHNGLSRWRLRISAAWEGSRRRDILAEDGHSPYRPVNFRSHPAAQSAGPVESE